MKSKCEVIMALLDARFKSNEHHVKKLILYEVKFSNKKLEILNLINLKNQIHPDGTVPTIEYNMKCRI